MGSGARMPFPAFFLLCGVNRQKALCIAITQPVGEPSAESGNAVNMRLADTSMALPRQSITIRYLMQSMYCQIALSLQPKLITRKHTIMKKTALLTLIFVLSSIAFVNVNAAKKTPREKLIERMTKLQKKGYMYGHQDDPFYGITWNWDEGRSDTYELVGDYPAVMGFDLGGIELGDSKNLDSVPFDRMRDEIVKHHERGGIITISWHPRNPLLGTTAWIQKDTVAYNQAVEALKQMRQYDVAKQVADPQHTVRSIIPGGSHHGVFQLWLKRVTDFLASLKDKKGNPVPLIFRPYHENSGSWFWWGQDNCSDEEYLALWNMTQDYVNATLKESIVWSYSPSASGRWTEQQWLVRYPGDDRIDLLGVDAYQWGTEEAFVKELNAELALITKLAKERGKLIAMTECGYQNSPDPTWWQRVFKPVIEKYPVCYLLPWRNYHKEHFGASPAAKTADDFKAWAKQKQFLFLKDIK